MCSINFHENNTNTTLFLVMMAFMLLCVSITTVSSNDQDITNSVHSTPYLSHQDTANDINSDNSEVDDVISTFRLLKYRDVYTLAKKRLHNPATLQDLAKKLKKMDKAEMMYKRQRDTGRNFFFSSMIFFFFLWCFDYLIRSVFKLSNFFGV